MNLLSSAKDLVPFVFMIVIAAGCKQPETIVIDRDPDITAGDTLDQQPVERQDISFHRLNIGELQPINSLDPLLADNSTAMRAIQLVYEGLVQFDETGDITPALAERWSVENNDRRYTFHLRPDVYYHDSEVFGGGTGRKFTAEDVIFVFERMAKNSVPPATARLFMKIQGFNSYFQEQQQVYNPELRQLDHVSGIQAPNDTTVVFDLDQPDRDFLQKLALPPAVIYPQEAVGKSNNEFTAIGTGPFRFSQQANDSTYIFSKFENYYAASDIQLDRVDLIVSSSGSELFNALENGNIHFLPELGPTLLQQLLAEDGALASSYAGRYSLAQTGSATYALRRYPPSGLSLDRAADIAQLAENNALSLFEPLGYSVAEPSFSTDDSEISSMTNLVIEAPAVDTPYGKVFLQQIADLLAEQGGKLEISDIKVPTQHTGLFLTEQLMLLPPVEWTGYPALITFEIPQFSLMRRDIDHLAANSYSWWLDLRGTELPAFENIN